MLQSMAIGSMGITSRFAYEHAYFYAYKHIPAPAHRIYIAAFMYLISHRAVVFFLMVYFIIYSIASESVQDSGNPRRENFVHGAVCRAFDDTANELNFLGWIRRIGWSSMSDQIIFQAYHLL